MIELLRARRPVPAHTVAGRPRRCICDAGVGSAQLQCAIAPAGLQTDDSAPGGEQQTPGSARSACLGLVSVLRRRMRHHLVAVVRLAPGLHSAPAVPRNGSPQRGGIWRAWAASVIVELALNCVNAERVNEPQDGGDRSGAEGRVQLAQSVVEQPATCASVIDCFNGMRQHSHKHKPRCRQRPPCTHTPRAPLGRHRGRHGNAESHAAGSDGQQVVPR